MGKYKNEDLISVKKERDQLLKDNIALGLQVSDLEISGMELGFQTSEMDIRITELEGDKTNV